MDNVELTDFDVARLRGTILGYEKFIKSAIWNDLSNELRIWAMLAGQDYDGAKDMYEVAKIQGRREAVAYLLQLPQSLLDALLDANTQSEEIDHE